MLDFRAILCNERHLLELGMELRFLCARFAFGFFDFRAIQDRQRDAGATKKNARLAVEPGARFCFCAA